MVQHIINSISRLILIDLKCVDSQTKYNILNILRSIDETQIVNLFDIIIIDKS